MPGLLFEAAYHLEVHELRENAWTISSLAVPGVVVAILLTALLLVAGKTLVGSAALLDWKTALFFGCVIAATDPVAVTSIFRELKAPRRLHVLVESESLLNDGTSIVFLTLMLAYFAGASPTAWSLGVEFGRIAGGGALIGLAIGWGVSRVRIAIDDPAIEITLTTIAAYGSFVAAEQVHCSGVVATVVAGVVCGNAGRHHSMTATTREAVDSFWEWLAFALNSAVFLLTWCGGIAFSTRRRVEAHPSRGTRCARETRCSCRRDRRDGCSAHLGARTPHMAPCAHLGRTAWCAPRWCSHSPASCRSGEHPAHRRNDCGHSGAVVDRAGRDDAAPST